MDRQEKMQLREEDSNILANLERQRCALEDNVAKLRKSLSHWQTLEVDYGSLTEELTRLEDDSTLDSMTNVAANSELELIDAKEIDDIFGLPTRVKRSRDQALEIISKRLEYAQRNAETLQKQLKAAEAKLQATLVVSEPDFGTEDGLPLVEVSEELDEDGKVVSSTVSNPAQASADVLATLKKAGIREFDDVKQEDQGEGRPGKAGPEAERHYKPSESLEQTGNTATKETSTGSGSALDNNSKVLDLAMAQTQPSPKSKKPEASSKASRAHGAPAFGDASFNEGTRIIELDEDDRQIDVRPVVIPDESPEDARMRREMLAYALRENAHVVAQLDLEEAQQEGHDEEDIDLDVDGDEIDLSDEPELSSMDEDDEDYDEDDDWGISMQRNISEEYRRNMEELDKRLNPDMGERQSEVHSQESPDPFAVTKSDETTSPTAASKGFTDATKADSSAKRKVRFADSLNVAPTAQTSPPTTSKPFASNIVERSRPLRSSTSLTSTDSPLQSNKTISDTIVERASTESSRRPGSRSLDGTSSGLDSALHRARLQHELQEERIDLIQQQGGFGPLGMTEVEKEKEEAEGPLMEARSDGRVRKVSRFRAARLRGQDI